MEKILIFKSPSCAPCKQMEPIIDDAIHSKLEYEFEIYDITVDTEIASKYRVRSVPTFIALGVHDTVLSVRTGFMTAHNFDKWMKDSDV